MAAGAAAAKLLLERLRGEAASAPELPEPVLVLRDFDRRRARARRGGGHGR